MNDDMRADKFQVCTEIDNIKKYFQTKDSLEWKTPQQLAQENRMKEHTNSCLVCADIMKELEKMKMKKIKDSFESAWGKL